MAYGFGLKDFVQVVKFEFQSLGLGSCPRKSPSRNVDQLYKPSTYVRSPYGL